RLRDFHQREHLHRLLQSGGSREILVQLDRLGDLTADREHRVERSQRLLEDHGNVVAAHAAHLRFVEREQVRALERHLAGNDLTRWIGNEPHDRERRRALAAAGFADDRQRLARAQPERYVVDGLEGALAYGEHRGKPYDVEHIRGPGRPRSRHLRLHQWRSLGSSRSRSASPSKLVPNTTRLMATPGKITSHGAVRTYSAADSDSILPQEGYGSGMPRPRNDSEASTRIAEPSCAVASTISGAIVLGSTCLIAMRSSLMPTAFAASTNGSSRSTSVFERTTRATYGISGMAMAMITFSSDGPS